MIDGNALTKPGPALSRRALLIAAGMAVSGARVIAKSETTSLRRFGDPIRWIAYYGANADEAVLASYDLVVLDPGFTGSIARCGEAGARVCGYLSLGEIRTADPNLPLVDPSILLPPNPDWPGTFRIDVRRPSWRSLVLDRLIPALAAQGFAGLMLDTLDTPPFLEAREPTRFPGMGKAAIDLVEAIRARWPRLTLIANRGYALLPDLVETIDAVIAESLLTRPGPDGRSYRWVGSREVEAQLALLRPAVRARPALPILSLDYWDPDDSSTRAEIYRRERQMGHHPYVATRLLDSIEADHNW